MHDSHSHAQFRLWPKTFGLGKGLAKGQCWLKLGVPSWKGRQEQLNGDGSAVVYILNPWMLAYLKSGRKAQNWRRKKCHRSCLKPLQKDSQSLVWLFGCVGGKGQIKGEIRQLMEKSLNWKRLDFFAIEITLPTLQISSRHCESVIWSDESSLWLEIGDDLV